MPFRDPTRVLILPPGISPPVIGQPALKLDPGPPNPKILLYTGAANERTPAEIAAQVSGLNPTLFIVGPDTTDSTFGPYNENMGISSGSAVHESFYESFAEDWAWYSNSTGTKLFALQSINGFNQPAAHQAQICAFETTATMMQAKVDRDNTAFNALTNTTYAATSSPCGFTFKGPPSGRGLLVCYSMLQLTTIANVARTCLSSPWLGTGTTIDAGTATAIEGITPASDGLRFNHKENDQAVVVTSIAELGEQTFLISGLTHNSDYNASLRHRITSATSANYDVIIQAIRWLPLY